MAKKSSRKPTTDAAPEAVAKRSDSAYPAEPHELIGQRQWLKKAAAKGAQALKSSAPPTLSVPAPGLESPSPAPGAGANQSPTPPLAGKVKITFILPICDAKQVSLSGDFNGWSPNATPMQRHDDGHWEATLELAPGRYEYKFVRDGEWVPDLLARENVWNQHGTLNSVVSVQA